MSRPVRIDVADGWYHVMARGFERGVVFGDDRDHEHFIELLEGIVLRYGVKLHAYVLLANHYHLLLQTPHANLSRAMQWLNVSYGMWFNRRHNRAGPLFQGRFKSVPIDGEGAWALQASVYVHLNPVRTRRFGLSRQERHTVSKGLVSPPSMEQVRSRLAALRGYRWSSYPAYAGYRSPPGWLTTGELWRRAQHRDWTPAASYRRQVEESLTGGVEACETPGGRIGSAVALGSPAFLDRLRRGLRGDRHEQPGLRSWQRLLPFSRVIELVEQEKGEPWEHFRDRHGDAGRDIALWLGRRHCGLTQAELGQAAGGMAYPAVGHAVRQMERRRKADRRLAKRLLRLEQQISQIAT
jgi:putative transposase